MVAQVRIEPFGTRHLDVIADGKRYGSIELDGKLFLAKPYALPSEWFRTQDEAVAHIVEKVGRLRARWQRALGRAIAEGLDPVAVASRTGMWFVPSGSDLNVGYLVERDGMTCTCPAGEGGDAVCKHRAVSPSHEGSSVVDTIDTGNRTGARAVLVLSILDHEAGTERTASIRAEQDAGGWRIAGTGEPLPAGLIEGIERAAGQRATG